MLQLRALKAIDAGGADGVSMAAVHKALLAARLTPQVMKLIIDRLEASGHILREEIATRGRPRVQMWSFKTIAEHDMDGETAMEMADKGMSEDNRPSWVGLPRAYIFTDIINKTGGALNLKMIEIAACQLYSGNCKELMTELFRGGEKKETLEVLDVLAMRGRIDRVPDSGMGARSRGQEYRMASGL
jgi:hypothetical protein